MNSLALVYDMRDVVIGELGVCISRLMIAVVVCFSDDIKSVLGTGSLLPPGGNSPDRQFSMLCADVNYFEFRSKNSQL